MNYFLQTFICIFSFLSFSNAYSAAQEFPKHQNRAVNDFAGVIRSDYAAQIETICNELWEKTHTAVVVVTVTDIGDNTIEEYANGLYEKWGIGQKGEDKGVLLINSVNDRKIRIETGYGVEGILPDGLTGSIMDNYIIPELQKGNYGLACLSGVKVLAGIISKDAGVEITGEKVYAPRLAQDSDDGISIWVIIIVVFLIIITRGRIISWLFFLSMLGGGSSWKSSSWGGRGGFSGGFGGFGGGSSGGGGASRSY